MNEYSLQSGDSQRGILLSNAISFLKFPLAVLVVILHSEISTKPYIKMGISTSDLADPLYANISWFLSRYLAYAAVPCFFVISGFLLFYNIDIFSWRVYVEKLKKRCKSLLVPYIVWCLIYLFLYWMIGQHNIILSEVQDLFGGDLSIIGFMTSVFIKPLDGPLWFIRNLFLMVVLSPILYCIIRKTKLLLPLFLLVLTQIIHSPIIESFLWFSFGMAFAIHKIDFLYICHKWLRPIIIITIISVVVDFILYPYLNIHITGYFAILKIMSVLGIGYWLVLRYPHIINNKAITNSSFTIYAYHGLAVLLFMPIIYNLTSGWNSLIMTYFITIIVVVAIGVILSLVINQNKIIRAILCGR